MQDKSVISIDSSLVARGRIAPAPYQLMLRISTEGKSEHAPSVRPQKRKERESGPLTKFTVPWISTYPHRFSCNSTADVRDQETDRHTQSGTSITVTAVTVARCVYVVKKKCAVLMRSVGLVLIALL